MGNGITKQSRTLVKGKHETKMNHTCEVLKF